MGNFSQDPTARAADALAKHYVAVRLQQGVPVVDADWNLLEDLRRSELETLASWFIGDGVPAGNDGFHIGPGANPNDFAISAGLIIASGRLTRNDSATTYATQPLFGKPIDNPLPALTTPVTDKGFFVYLDVWLREVDSQEDSGITDARIGVEAAIRLKREWAVRVARIPEDVPGLSTPPPGHVFLTLAQLNRKANVATITRDEIVDLRNTQLSVLRRVEARDSNGVVQVDETRFSNMLLNTRVQFLNFVSYISTTFNSPTTALTSAEIIGLQAGQNVAQLADAGLAQAHALTVANQGALLLMRQLYDAQENFFNIWLNYVLLIGGTIKKYGSYQAFVTRLGSRLNDQTVAGTQLTGLKPALAVGDLIGATATQEEIIRLVGTGAASITRGTIQISYSNAPPGVLSPVGNIVQFQFLVTSFTTLADTFTVNILPATGWPRVLVDGTGNPIPNNKVPLGISGSQVTLFVNVTIQAGASQLQVQVSADSNPAEVTQASSLLTLTLNQPPPPPDNQIAFQLETPFQATLSNGVLTVPRPPKPQPGSIGVRIFNRTTQNLTNIALAAGIVQGTQNGTWTVALSGPATVNINAGQDVKPGGVNITAGSDAVSVQVLFTATATISGSNVVSQVVVSVVSSS